MRIALGEIVQETGTFTPSRMGRDAFEAYGLYQGAELLEVLAAVHAFEQKRVGVPADLFDGLADFQPVLILQGFRKPRHPVAAHGTEFASSRVGRHHPASGHMVLGLRIVEELNERLAVARVQPDHPDLELHLFLPAAYAHSCRPSDCLDAIACEEYTG